MPAVYAHFRFGQEVFCLLPESICEIIAQYKELYDIGLHGPDVLFYHGPIVGSKVSKTGGAYHKRSGKSVFADCKKVLASHNSSPMYLAYVYGYLCHFALDCTCHGYIADYIKKTGIGHHEIEMEFDRSLEVQDGHDPVSFSTTDHIVPSMRNAAVISEFYDDVTPSSGLKSLKSMIKYLRMLRAPNDRSRSRLLNTMHLTGRYNNLKGLIMSRTPNPKCNESNKQLKELFESAVPLAVKMICEYDDKFCDNNSIDRHYGLNFKSEAIEEI